MRALKATVCEKRDPTDPRYVKTYFGSVFAQYDHLRKPVLYTMWIFLVKTYKKHV